MNELLDLREKLQDTHATMARLREALAASPEDDALALMAESLLLRQEDLEVRFSEVANSQQLDICKYRLIPETGEGYPILGLTKILGEFQELVTTVFDAIKTHRPKTRARIAPELVQLSSFDFGYVAPGSLEIVLTVPNDRLLLIESELDQAVSTVFRLMKSDDSREIGELASQVGVASIKKLYELAENHYKYALTADITWARAKERRDGILVQPVEFERLCGRLAEKSDETTEAVTVRGRLVGLDVDLGTFHMTFPEGEDIRGRIGGAFRQSKPAEVPGNYIADMIKTTVIYYSTQEDKVSYELVELRQR
jgi:hypothetical protein